MSIKKFIQEEVMLPRLKKKSVLVVYDAAHRLRDLCLELASDTCRVIDVSESSIEGREQAMQTLQKLGSSRTKIEGMIVYVPTDPPVSEEQKQADPFAVYGACGSVFPEGDGDEYQSLCLKAKADYVAEIRRIFQDNPNPSFDVIDAVGGGSGWPNLEATLKVESARDLIYALLVPSAEQQQALKEQDGWVSETKDLFNRCLGLTLKTRSKSWATISEELWRFLLFSEFAFDLPGELPEALADVPVATDDARPVVEDLCDRLRNDQRTQSIYIERAESIESDLNLPSACKDISDHGDRDTFPFEERAYFKKAVEALKSDNLDGVRPIVERHSQSVWVKRGENQSQWMLLQAASDVLEVCEDLTRQLTDHAQSQSKLIEFYIGYLREADRLHREFEQAAADSIDQDDVLKDVFDQPRRAYRKLAYKVQELFAAHLAESGWPPSGGLSNADVFDRFVAPKIQERGDRVAYVLIDSLRYELGLNLSHQLEEEGEVVLQPAFALLPSVTTVGMAGLLPSAGAELRLAKEDSGMVPVLSETRLTSVTQRMEVFKKRFGNRFDSTPLLDFIRGQYIPEKDIELLVIRSNTIDSQLEAAPDMALRMIQDSLKQIRVAIRRLRNLGFKYVIVATDHGFFLNTGIEPGDVCSKPEGAWVNLHERLLLGDGSESNANFVMPADKLGIRTDYNQVAGPKALVAYRKGLQYFHGGLSLQECVVPVLEIKLRSEEKEAKRITVELSYKRGAKKVTTRLPVIEVRASGEDLFDAAAEVEVLIEADDKDGKVIGEAAPGGPISPSTGTLSVKSGTTVPVTIRMDMEYEGKFTIKALNPVTMEVLSKIELETDYAV